MRLSTLIGDEQFTDREMQMADETITLDWTHEHARWEKELRGLVRAMGWKALKRLHRPKAAWDDMVSDMEIFSWRAWRSLRLRGLEPQTIGIWAIADRAVRSSLQGARFQPVGTRGDRSWADSVHNKRNGLKVRSNREEWQITGEVGDGQDESDLLSDWSAWKGSLGDVDRELVEALVAGNTEKAMSVKDVKRRKRTLADGFRRWRT